MSGRQAAVRRLVAEEVARAGPEGRDVVLVGADGEQAACHAVLLAAACPWLGALLAARWGPEEAEPCTVLLPDWGPGEVAAAASLLYTGRVLLPAGGAQLGARVADGLAALGMEGAVVEEVECLVCGHRPASLAQHLEHLEQAHGPPEGGGELAAEAGRARLALARAAPRSLLGQLAVSRWTVCPLCRRPATGRPEMVGHLILHSEVRRLLEAATPPAPAYACLSACPPVWQGRIQFLLHKYRNCKQGAAKTFDEFLDNNTVTDVMGEREVSEFESVTTGSEAEGAMESSAGEVGETESGVETGEADSEPEEGQGTVTRRRSASGGAEQLLQAAATGTAPAGGMAGEDDVWIKCEQCLRVFETTDMYCSRSKHFCQWAGAPLASPPLEDKGERTIIKMNTMTCISCRGEGTKGIRSKPLFATTQDLMKHYTLGHHAMYLQMQMKKKGVSRLPAPCCQPGCTETLQDWEQAVLHLGIQHQRLFWALKHERREEGGIDYKYVLRRLFPEKAKMHLKTPAKKPAGPRVLSRAGVAEETLGRLPGKRKVEMLAEDDGPLTHTDTKKAKKVTKAALKLGCHVCPEGDSRQYSTETALLGHMADVHFTTFILAQYPAGGEGGPLTCGFPNCLARPKSEALRARHLGIQHRQVSVALSSPSRVDEARAAAKQSAGAAAAPDTSLQRTLGRIAAGLPPLKKSSSAGKPTEAESTEAALAGGENCSHCGSWESQPAICDAYKCGETFHCSEEQRSHFRTRHKWSDM